MSDRYRRQVVATADKWNEVATEPEARGHIHPAWWEAGDEGYFELGQRDAVAVIDAASDTIGGGMVDWRVLDVGCGDGRVLLPLAERGVGQGNGTLVGLDTSPNMLDRLETTAVDPFDFATFLGVPGEDWPPHMGEPFDVVYSFNVFIHLPSPEKLATLHRIATVLRPGGVAVLQLPLYSEKTEPVTWTGVGVWTRKRLTEALLETGLLPWRLLTHDHPYQIGSAGEFHHVPQILRKA